MVRHETTELLEHKNHRTPRTLFNIALSNFFLDMFPWANATKETRKQMRLHQIKKVLHSKETIKKTKDNLLNERRYLQITHLICGYCPK